ncbi:MAG: hypothetical protein QXX20_00550 [Candidatus Thermoplasmatota archaeon]
MDLTRVKFFKATLFATSFLYFYSTEFLKTTTVDRVLHNWALMFAVNQVKADPNKRHLENLKDINFYCTPGTPKNVETKSFLLNPVPEDTEAGKLSLMRVERFLPGSEFEFIIMSMDGTEPPFIISYGKKKSHHMLQCGCRECENKKNTKKEWHELKIKPIYKEQIKIKPSRFINPLDFKKIDEITYAKKHPMKPSPLYVVEGKFYDVLVLSQIKEVFPNNFPPIL